MAKKSSIQKQLRRERLCALKREKRAELKKVVKSLNSTEEERENAMIALNKLPRNSSPVRLRNRCQFTGRARGYLRKFRLSRITFREMAREGLLPGLTKASW